jgi:SecD/SecF fusion protein
MKSKLLTGVLVTLAVVAICLWEIWPPDKRIRIGKDLRGGVSLVYSVEMPEGADSQRVLAQVIDSLKRRVNPRGVLDISMQPQGSDRIEVVMPLPSPAVKALGDSYNAMLLELGARTQVTARQLERALAEGKAADFAPPGDPKGDTAAGARRDLLSRLQAAYDAAKDGRVRLASLAADAPERDAEEERLAQAEIDERKIFEQVLASSVPVQRLKRAMQLSTDRPPLRDARGRVRVSATGDIATGPSPRETEVAAVKAMVPDFADRIDALVKAYDDYASVVTGYDDPEDLKRLMRAAGVLEFHIPVSAASPEGVNVDDMTLQLKERGADGTDSPVARWFRINSVKQFADSPEQIDAITADPATFMRARDLVATGHDGYVWVLLYTTEAMSLDHLGGRQWSMKSVFPSQDQLGRAAVAFQLDPAGGQLMGRLTGPNIGRPMAIVLDGEVYSAPTLQSQINANGQISGNFSPEDIDYLIRVLQGGELEAKLRPEPISVSMLGPAIGRDNLERGFSAVFASAIAVGIAMVLYYFGAGIIACIALAINGLMIFGIMAAIDGTFTLPGLAGVALTMGIAVDANVLIYERIREELVDRGESLPMAVQMGFSRALSAIVDGNITNLIVCAVLYKFGATEVKGFGLTMMIGTMTTLFTGLYVSRVCFNVCTGPLGIRRLPMLPTVIPGMMRVLRPNIDWIGMRWALWSVAGLLAVSSLVLTVATGREMLDTEFRGGIAMTMSTRKAEPGEPAGSDGKLLIARPEVERRIREIGEQAPADALAVRELRNATVLTVGESTSDFQATAFQIKLANPPSFTEADTLTEPVVTAVANAFAAELDLVMPITFRGLGDPNDALYVKPVLADSLGELLGIAGRTESLRDWNGGAAVVVEGIEPPISVDDAEIRIARMRSQPDFSAISARPFEVLAIETLADGKCRSMLVLVNDPAANLSRVDAATWTRLLAGPEWNLVQQAFSQKLSVDQVSSFSPKVAENLAATAIVAVSLSLIGMLLYIWLRFNSLRYSLATVVGLMFNLCCCLGALALSLRFTGSAFGRATYVEDFRIDLNVISGLLAIIGYSLNDTVVILDRIRENKGKLMYAGYRTVNDSINQTFSRTLLTGGTVLLTAGILFFYGGSGIRPFAFTFIVGLIAGTVSSVVIAAPMTYVRREDRSEARRAESADAVAEPAPDPA